ncbi:uncharacterized protein LOC105438792 [Strongylocentrotus purpuratus]|uniref:Uncharacterized protein n=1 Tax=Strongylocentrotus purpuratus TaxID=7668 RepID=A0A7M7NCW0_STRPU|nr:uncharacterized protein LOC105438792 [Strongylocentrotus purpuratus]
MLEHLDHLKEVLIIWASFPSTIPPVFSVRHFSIDLMADTMSYSKALGFVPSATTVNVGMGYNERDGVVGAIARGIVAAAKSLEDARKELTTVEVAWKELTVDGYAGSGVVSFETGQELANRVGYLPHLEVLELCRVDMNEKALIAIVEKCLEITTIKEIRIGLCGSRVGGALDTLLQSLCQVGGGIIITVYHSLEYVRVLSPLQKQ